VGRRVLRSNHDRHRVNLYGGILQNHVAANARGLGLQIVPLLAPQSPLELTLPLRP
jgi:hypothetical protein